MQAYYSAKCTVLLISQRNNVFKWYSTAGLPRFAREGGISPSHILPLIDPFLHITPPFQNPEYAPEFTVISNTYTSRDIRITRACTDSDEKTLHSSQCYGSYCSQCSAIKFVTQKFVTEARTWPCTSYMSVYIGLYY